MIEMSEQDIPPSSQGNTAGFTLAEVVIAMMVLAIGMSASILVITTALNRSDSGRNRMTALHDARNQLETLRAFEFTDPEFAEGTHTNAALNLEYDVADDAANANLKLITVRSDWYNRIRRTNQVVEIETMMARQLR